MKRTVLITRAIEHAEQTAQDVRALGFAAILDPLLTIVPLEQNYPVKASVDALIITSRNALIGQAVPKDLPLFIVGEETARLCKEAGFTNIQGVALQSADLPVLIKQKINYSAHLVHLTSEDAHTEFYNPLLDVGFGIEQMLVYKAHAATSFQSATSHALKQTQIKAIMFYSARTAAIFSNLASTAGLKESLNGITAFCLSDAVVQSLAPPLWKKVITATAPTHKDMLDCLANWG